MQVSNNVLMNIYFFLIFYQRPEYINYTHQHRRKCVDIFGTLKKKKRENKQKKGNLIKFYKTFKNYSINI